MDQSHRIWQSNGSAAHVARFVEPPGGAGSIAGLSLSKQVALDRSWLFLQPNNSQCSSCQVRNTKDFYRVCDPYAANPGKAPGWSFQNERCHLFYLFYQNPDQARLSPTG